MDSNLLTKMEEIVKCPICQGILAVPKTLQCCHTFCEECISSVLKEVNENEATFYCPVCNENCQKNEILDTKLMKDITDMHEILNDEDPNCKLCQFNKPEWKCVQCRINFICHDCLREHLKLPAATPIGHNIAPCENIASLFIDNAIPCEKHSKEIKECYCPECQLFICKKCSKTIHKQHQTITVEDALKDIVPYVQQQIDKVKADIVFLEKEIDHFSKETESFNKLCMDVKIKYSTVTESDILMMETYKLVKISEYENKKCEDLQKLEQDHKQLLDELQRKYEANIVKVHTKCAKDIERLQAEYEQDRLSKGSECNQALNELEENASNCSISLQKHTDALTAEMRKKQYLFNLTKFTLENVKYGSLMETLESWLKCRVEYEAKKKSEAKCISMIIPEFIYDQHCITYRKVDKGTLNQRFNIRSLKTTFRKIISKANQRQDILVLGESLSRISVVQNSFWIPADQLGHLEIYSLTGEKIKTIKINGISNIPRVLQQINDNEVFLACEEGLFVLDTQGTIQYKLCDGDFCDVTSNGYEVVAATMAKEYDGDEKMTTDLYSFSYNGKMWQQSHYITIHIPDKSAEFKMSLPESDHIHKSKVNIVMQGQVVHLNIPTYCSSIYVYNMKDKSPLGYLQMGNDCILCGIDQQQHLILCEGDKIKTMSNDGSLKENYLEGLTQVRDVLVLEDKIYVIRSRFPSYFEKIVTLTTFYPA